MSEDRPAVFVIDDDPSMRRSLDTLLRSVALDVHIFSSTQEFMHAKRPEAPGCLVLDVRLPGMSGLTFQRGARESGGRSSDHLHQRAWRRCDDRTRDEGRRRRVPHQAVRRQVLLDAINAAIERDRQGVADAASLADLKARYRAPRIASAKSWAGRHGAGEQADRGRTQTEPGHREGPPRPGHAQDAGEIRR